MENFWSEAYTFSGLTPEADDIYAMTNQTTRLAVFGDWGIGPVGWDTRI